MVVRRASGLFTPIIDDIIWGDRSPITTKNATQVPSKKPIIPSSTASFPVEPYTWNAESKKKKVRCHVRKKHLGSGLE